MFNGVRRENILTTMNLCPYSCRQGLFRPIKTLAESRNITVINTLHVRFPLSFCHTMIPVSHLCLQRLLIPPDIQQILTQRPISYDELILTHHTQHIASPIFGFDKLFPIHFAGQFLFPGQFAS